MRAAIAKGLARVVRAATFNCTGQGVRTADAASDASGARPGRERLGESSRRELGERGGDDILIRRSTSWERASRLDRQSKTAEAHGFPHGVSVTTLESNIRLSRDPTDVSQATRPAFEDAGFRVHDTPTRRDPNHHTVALPNPVIIEVAEKFNELFGRSKP